LHTTDQLPKIAKIYPIRLPPNVTFPKAEAIDLELISSSQSDTETQQLLHCWIREHLVSLQYVVQHQQITTSFQSSQISFRVASIRQQKLPLSLHPAFPDELKQEVSSGAHVTRSSIVSIATSVSKQRVEPRVSTKLQEESAYATLGGLDQQIDELKRLVEMPLRRPEVFKKYGLRPPRGLLLFGPPGTGKTTLAYSAAKSCVDSESIEVISGPELTSSLHGGTERALRKVFARARRNSPSVVIIDEIDALAPRRDGGDASSDGAGEVEKRVVATLLTLMDGLGGTDDSSRVVVIAATNRPNAIDPALRRPGRLDREIEVGIPTSDARHSILSVLLRGVPNTLDVDQLQEIANRTHGYVGADLSALVREAGMRAVSRETDLVSQLNHISLNGDKHTGLTYSDFTAAQAIIRPSAMREISLELPKVTWNDIAPGQAGLHIQQKVRECVEWPLKHKDTMQRLGISAPRGVLLYGPPGCSKTLIARALASESGLNFVAVKGPELLNKYVGESERALREVFRKARAASPSIIFFDEIDGLTTTRGTESASSDKVIATLLNEMDGIEQLANVLVVAATNRPEVIDYALLRPGRLDRLLYVAPPDTQARRQILALRSRMMTLDDGVDLDRIAIIVSGVILQLLPLLICFRRRRDAREQKWYRYVRRLV
jgi:AAA family ATPase